MFLLFDNDGEHKPSGESHQFIMGHSVPQSTNVGYEMAISHRSLNQVAQKAARDMGNMRMPTEAVIAEFEPTACSLQVIHLRTRETLQVMAAANGHAIGPEDVHPLLQQLVATVGQTAEHFVFKCVELESGEEQLIHWDLRTMRERTLFGRVIKSDPE